MGATHKSLNIIYMVLKTEQQYEMSYKHKMNSENVQLPSEESRNLLKTDKTNMSTLGYLHASSKVKIYMAFLCPR